MPRLFIAVPIDDSVRSNLSRIATVAARSDSMGRGVSWVSPENLHVTLAFLGEVEEHGVDEVEDIIYAATEEPGAALNLQARGIGAYPNEEKARVMWAGVDGEVPRLIDLQARLASELKRAGFEVDSKRYRPHITLARFRWPQRLPDRLPRLQEFGEWRAEEVQLIESQLRPSGARYVIRADVPLDE